MRYGLNPGVAYWGDIDTWGLSILSDVSSKLPSVKALMMDEETLEIHEDRMVGEHKSVDDIPEFLVDSEVRIFSGLKAGNYFGTDWSRKDCPRTIYERNLKLGWKLAILPPSE